MEKQTDPQVLINLTDLEVADAPLKLSRFPDKVFTLGAYTLRVQLWAIKTFGEEKLQHSIQRRDIETLCQLAYHVLKEKDVFPTYDDFLDAIYSHTDRTALTDAVLHTVGLSQPVLQKLAADLEAAETKKKGNGESPVAPTGQNTTT